MNGREMKSMELPSMGFNELVEEDADKDCFGFCSSVNSFICATS